MFTIAPLLTCILVLLWKYKSSKQQVEFLEQVIADLQTHAQQQVRESLELRSALSETKAEFETLSSVTELLNSKLARFEKPSGDAAGKTSDVEVHERAMLSTTTPLLAPLGSLS